MFIIVWLFFFNIFFFLHILFNLLYIYKCALTTSLKNNKNTFFNIHLYEKKIFFLLIQIKKLIFLNQTKNYIFIYINQVNRHIGPNASETAEMLKVCGANSLDEFMDSSIPKIIKDPNPMIHNGKELPPPLPES